MSVRAHVKRTQLSLCNLISLQVANLAGNRRGRKMATLHVVLAVLQEVCTSNFPTVNFSLILSFGLLYYSILIYFHRLRACGRLLLSLQEGR